jgi:hypothetical protein
MSKKQKLYSINSLTGELRRNFRTLAKALASVPADGTLAGRPAWHLSSAIAAMREYETGSNRFDGRLSVDDAGGEDAVPPAIAAAVDAVQDLVKRMRSEPDVDRRRELLRADGKRVGRLHQLIESDLRARGPEYTEIYKPYFSQMFAHVTAETMALCELRYVPDDGGGNA